MSENFGVVSAVNRQLEHALGQQQDQLHAVSDAATVMGDALASLAQHGKRMRALLCYWGWRGAGGPSLDTGMAAPIVAAGAALELFQTAALIHDDVIDRSDTRRGIASVHQQFSRRHLDGGWAGDHGHFGYSAALLTGDMCLAASDRVFSDTLAQMLTAGTDPGIECARFARAREVFSTMQTEVMAGQYLDLLSEVAYTQQPPAEQIDNALRVIRYKAARYSTEHPLRIGGALAGADDALLEHYGAFALPLGEAFQLRDDLLGVFGDPDVTGKPAGDDLREGKRTVLIGYTLKNADAAGRETLHALLGAPNLDEAGVRRARAVITASGAPDAVENLIDDLSQTALRELDTLAIDPDARGALAELARAAVARFA